MPMPVLSRAASAGHNLSPLPDGASCPLIQQGQEAHGSALHFAALLFSSPAAEAGRARHLHADLSWQPACFPSRSCWEKAGSIGMFGQSPFLLFDKVII